MDADEERVKDFLESKGFAPERFTKQEIRAGKTPDFQVLLNGDLQFFYEVKSSQEDRWLDEQLENAEAG